MTNEMRCAISGYHRGQTVYPSVEVHSLPRRRVRIILTWCDASQPSDRSHRVGARRSHLGGFGEIVPHLRRYQLRVLDADAVLFQQRRELTGCGPEQTYTGTIRAAERWLREQGVRLDAEGIHR